MLEMKLATCEAVMGVLPESTDSLKTSYLSRESTYRLVIVDFGLVEGGSVRLNVRLDGASPSDHSDSEAQHGGRAVCTIILYMQINLRRYQPESAQQSQTIQWRRLQCTRCNHEQH